ncbi:MAG: tRNA (adenosine(37)-N6)-threonylcarbamoyltransferase complex ATPase subunit type 1 TsaE [Betaproteobacteria bacterium]
MHTLILELDDAAASEAVGRALAPALQPGMVVTLSGDLGAGKTTLVRGVLRGMDIPGPIKSPTYTLVEPYNVSRLYLYHFDLYRLKDPEEWEAAGFRDYFGHHSISLIEWPERARLLLPPVDLQIVLNILDVGRQCVVCALSERAEPCLDALSRQAVRSSAFRRSASNGENSSAG